MPWLPSFVPEDDWLRITINEEPEEEEEEDDCQ